ncbi:MAG: hypothetical protein NT038_06370 [Euryarchaeota archaeon]|nr:hypothetical protein [Euryarchaeota archaeon]
MSSLTMVRSFLQSRYYEHLSRRRLLKIQQRKFRRIVRYAFDHSSFYRELYKSEGITRADLKSIPFDKLPSITKNMVMERFDDVLTDSNVTKSEVLDFLAQSKDPNELFKGKYHVVHTSGSSGKIGVFLYNKREWDYLFPYITTSYDFRFSKKKSVFLGATGGHFAGVSFSSWMNKGFSRLFTETLVVDINEPTERLVEKLNAFQPDIVGGYFTGLKVLAEQQEKGNLRIHPSLLVNCAEGNIILHQKEYITGVFHAPMNNNYGFAECIIVGVGRDEYGGILLRDDLVLIEFFEDYILVTNLFNKTEPLIRYRIDDCLKQKKSSLRYPFTLVDNVVGRSEFIINLENDFGEIDYIHPLIFTDFYVKGLSGLQFVLKDKKSFDVRVMIAEKEREHVIQAIKKKLDEWLAIKHFTSVSYTIQVVEKLPVDQKTGKFKLIVKQ